MTNESFKSSFGLSLIGRQSDRHVIFLTQETKKIQIYNMQQR